jgi:N-acetylglucosaminyl-diphospho-decaprenol L-rhamnosyltransferase
LSGDGGPAAGIRAVVVHYDTPELTADCVRSLLAEGVVVTIVDNDSPGAAWDRLRDRCGALPGVSMIQLPSNDGFGPGVNAGVASIEAGFRGYVWVVNPDMRADPGAAAALAGALASGAADIVCPSIYAGEGDRRSVYYVGGSLDLERVEADHWAFGQPFVPDDGLVACSFISGACFMLARATWDALGGLPADYFLYWEDAALSYRAQSLGLRIGVERAARMWHRVGGSTPGSGISRTTYYYTCRNRFLVSRLWGTPLISLLAGRASGPTYRWLVRALLREPGDRLGRCLAALRGTGAGILLRTVFRRRPAGRGSY